MAQRIFILSIYQPQGFVHLVAVSLHDDGLKRAGEVPTSCGTVWLAHVRNGERSLMSCSARSRRCHGSSSKPFALAARFKFLSVSDRLGVRARLKAQETETTAKKNISGGELTSTAAQRI